MTDKKRFSRLMLGTVQFGMRYGIANTTGKPDLDQVEAILRAAADGGVTALDTAAAYGDSEQILGQVMQRAGLAGHFTVVSKIPPMPADADPEAFIRASLQRSLANLRLDVLPVALLHREDDIGRLPILAGMIQQGLVQGVGVSVDSAPYAEAGVALEYVQAPCNVLDHRFDGLLAARAAQGRFSFIRSVYLQGLLLMPEERVPAALAPLLPYRRKLADFGLPLKELCLRYLLTQPGENSVLTGVDTVDQLRENIRLAAAGPLPMDVFQAIKAVAPDLPETLIRPKCWPA
ncbi:MAG TPA: aldo/keto reductase [Lentisphaeria bacterium]|nr:MAG: putative oxidoreductase [Lentisphaerae bacterium ADurb.Bin082]HPY89238.1 aldo/keto reductase [Lentisphaeria bacterium]HQC52603.1 aldo/keto reductase [Lentisphaeria bacterium]HQL87863.1 aldo/keto reductase [Lentisphaeria bacterium]